MLARTTVNKIWHGGLKLAAIFVGRSVASVLVARRKLKTTKIGLRMRRMLSIASAIC